MADTETDADDESDAVSSDGDVVAVPLGWVADALSAERLKDADVVRVADDVLVALPSNNERLAVAEAVAVGDADGVLALRGECDALWVAEGPDGDGVDERVGTDVDGEGRVGDRRVSLEEKVCVDESDGVAVTRTHTHEIDGVADDVGDGDGTLAECDGNVDEWVLEAVSDGDGRDVVGDELPE